jgi:hypothetical protein
MTESTTHKGQIPTDPTTLLLLALAVTSAAGQLTPDQTQALTTLGGITDTVLLILSLARGGR